MRSLSSLWLPCVLAAALAACADSDVRMVEPAPTPVPGPVAPVSTASVGPAQGVVTYATPEAAEAASAARVVQAEIPPAPVMATAAPAPAPTREVVAVADRREVWIVGHPPMVEDAETILRTTGFPDLKLDGDGSDLGVSAFCEGVGLHTPDILAIDRPLTDGERALCESRNVGFNSMGAIGGFIAIKDAHAAFVPNLSEAFEALR